MIEVGQKAPAFTLRNQDDDAVRLAAYRGRWVVLYFYPRDDTPGCTKEACEFTGNLKEFKRLDAIVLGCSPDAPESHRKFIAKHKLKIQLLSDPKYATMEKYGAWGTKVLYGRTSLGVIRSTVLIDPAGKIAYHWKKVRAAGHAAHVAARLVELRRED